MNHIELIYDDISMFVLDLGNILLQVGILLLAKLCRVQGLMIILFVQRTGQTPFFKATVDWKSDDTIFRLEKKNIC